MRAGSDCGERRIPGLRQLITHGLIIEGGQAGKELRCNTHVGGALFVRFFGHGIDAATGTPELDRKSTRLNSSHGYISYAVFCLKKKRMARPLQCSCAAAS